MKDLPLAEKFRDILGYGMIIIKKEDNACVLNYYKKFGLIYVVSLMNSYLRTPKLIKFNQLIDILNKRYGTGIEKYPYQIQEFSKDGWLAGFAEADGSFGIVYNKTKTDESGKTITKRQVACRFRIDHRIICPNSNESYEPFLNKKNLATFLKVKLTVVNRTNGNQYFNITAKSRESLSIIKIYFNTYPLISSKYLDYLDWQRVVNLILSQSHYEERGKTKFRFN